MTNSEKLERELKVLDLNEGCRDSGIACTKFEKGERLAWTKKQVAKDKIMIAENKRVINILEKIVKLENELEVL